MDWTLWEGGKKRTAYLSMLCILYSGALLLQMYACDDSQMVHTVLDAFWELHII